MVNISFHISIMAKLKWGNKHMAKYFHYYCKMRIFGSYL